MKTIQTVFLLCVFLSSVVLAETKHSAFDNLKIAAQKICPVTGRPLGSMGDPLKVRIGKEEIFLCSKSCAKGTINKEHWITIHRNFAAAQRMCPVMEKPLPANPESTIVNGQSVYVCCPPCTKKIQADPKKYLTKMAGYYQAALRNPGNKGPSAGEDVSAKIAKLPLKDQARAMVQKICPVSGNALGALGVPDKVRVGKLDVFLCCEGCRDGKINQEHWKTIAHNIKKAQAICPVMEHELPKNAKSTTVAGQLVYVCCPPCTKKIAADPEKYLSKVDAYYKESIRESVRVSSRAKSGK